MNRGSQSCLELRRNSKGRKPKAGTRLACPRNRNGAGAAGIERATRNGRGMPASRGMGNWSTMNWLGDVASLVNMVRVAASLQWFEDGVRAG